jgi:hypothetical protein
MIEDENAKAYFCDDCFPNILQKNGTVLRAVKVTGKQPKHARMFTSTVQIDSLTGL